MAEYKYGTSEKDGQTKEYTQVSYIHSDYLASPAILTNMNKAITQTITKNAWGNPITNTFDKDTHIQTDFGYTGHKEDTESGLTYAHARYLNTNSKQWLSHDPFSLENFTDESWLLNPQLQNSYSYAGNDPVNAVDPDGKIPSEAEALQMVGQIYEQGNENQNLSGGWTYNQDMSVTGSLSMKMGVYSREVEGKKEYSLVFRGSRGLHPVDWFNNLMQPIGGSQDARDAIKYSAEFVKNNPNNEVTMIGHSKGGAEADLASAKNNTNAFIFNSAPASFLFNRLYYEQYARSKEVKHLIVQGDIVTGTLGYNKNPSTSITIKPQAFYPTISTGRFSSVKNIISNLKTGVANHVIQAFR